MSSDFFELLKILLTPIGAIIGAFIGSYLASYWREVRRLKREHWESIRENLLQPLLISIEYRIPIIENRTLEKMGFLYMIEHSLSPTWRDELYKDVDRKLREVSLTEHFPNLAERLEKFEEALSDYDEQYINLARRVQTVILSENIQKERLLEKFTKYFAYILLEEKKGKWLEIPATMDDAESVIFDQKKTIIAKKKEMVGLKQLAYMLIDLSKEIHGKALELEDEIRDLIKIAKTKRRM